MSNGMAIGTSPEHQDFCRWDLVLLDFARRCTWYDNMWHLCRQSKTPWCGSERVWLSWLSFLCFQLFVQAETFSWNEKLEFCWFPSTKDLPKTVDVEVKSWQVEVEQMKAEIIWHPIVIGSLQWEGRRLHVPTTGGEKLCSVRCLRMWILESTTINYHRSTRNKPSGHYHQLPSG